MDDDEYKLLNKEYICANCGKTFEFYCAIEDYAWKRTKGTKRQLFCTYTCKREKEKADPAKRRKRLN